MGSHLWQIQLLLPLVQPLKIIFMKRCGKVLMKFIALVTVLSQAKSLTLFGKLLGRLGLFNKDVFQLYKTEVIPQRP